MSRAVFSAAEVGATGGGAREREATRGSVSAPHLAELAPVAVEDARNDRLLVRGFPQEVFVLILAAFDARVRRACG